MQPVQIFRSDVELPWHPTRASKVWDLIQHLCAPPGVVTPLHPASVDEVCVCHSRHYVDYLRTREAMELGRKRLADGAPADVWLPEQPRDEEYGLKGDAQPYLGFWDASCRIAAASIAAAEALRSGAARIAVHWEGGRHHASYSAASGFCFINDVALAAKRLARRLPDGSAPGRVLVVDIDAHFGDGTATLCYGDPNIFCLSTHVFGAGMFPGTGAADESSPRSRVLNVALPPGSGDAVVLPLFEEALGACVSQFQPSFIVAVCGCDAIQGDRLGHLNLTVHGFCSMAVQCLRLGLPVLLLGGGGYQDVSAARAWAALTFAAMHGGELPALDTDIPVECVGFPAYAPGFKLFDNVPPIEPACRGDATVMRATTGALREFGVRLGDADPTPSVDDGSDESVSTSSLSSLKTDASSSASRSPSSTGSEDAHRFDALYVDDE